MIVVPTTPSDTPWPVVQPTNSPYWLRVNGQWVHLDGVRRGSRLTTERDTSDLVTIDGVRQRWVAPAGPRSWRLQLQDATPVAVAALMLACDFPGDVLLVDRDLTTANMLAGASCQGTGPVLLAGGLPLRTFTAPVTVYAYVRGGVRTYVSVWAPGGAAAATVTWPGGDAELVAPAGTLAQRAVVDVVPDADGPLAITAAAGTTGLQVTEDWLPEHWLPGRNAPCPVAVVDPERTLEYLGRRRYSRSSYDVQLDEVGAL